MVSAKGKRLGDMFAGTYVIQERAPRRPELPPALATVPPPLLGWAQVAADLPAVRPERRGGQQLPAPPATSCARRPGTTSACARHGGLRPGQPATAARHAARRLPGRGPGHPPRPRVRPPGQPAPRPATGHRATAARRLAAPAAPRHPPRRPGRRPARPMVPAAQRPAAGPGPMDQPARRPRRRRSFAGGATSSREDGRPRRVPLERPVPRRLAAAALTLGRPAAPYTPTVPASPPASPAATSDQAAPDQPAPDQPAHGGFAPPA